MKFAVLGPAETCTGDPARRIGNEFVFSMLAQQNIETLNEAAPKTIVASCPHCFNTIAKEYPQLGGNYEVIHHTQLLARLVDQGKLTPDGTAAPEKITYHDPCFLGRHNKVYTPPRQIMEPCPGSRRSRCTGARNAASAAARAGPGCGWRNGSASGSTPSGSTRPWPWTPDTISTACPYCLVMLGDAVAAKKASGEAKDTLEVIDVAQLLVRSVAPVGAAVASAAGSAPAGDAAAGAATAGTDANPGPPAEGTGGPAA